MNAKEIKELLDYLIEKDIAEFELERGDVKMRMKRAMAPAAGGSAPGYAPLPAVPMPAAPLAAPGSATAPVTPAAEAEQAGLHTVRSPIVGTFYEAASPGAAPFVKPGDSVQSGQVLCIIEAMKLMNEIESDVSGTIVKRLVENAQPVEYGQALFAIRVAG